MGKDSILYKILTSGDVNTLNMLFWALLERPKKLRLDHHFSHLVEIIQGLKTCALDWRLWLKIWNCVLLNVSIMLKGHNDKIFKKNGIFWKLMQ